MECLLDFDFQPTLTGTLIEIRPLKPEDFNALFEAAGDPLIWEQHPENDRYKREIFQKYFDGAIESKGAFAVIERKTGRIIGSSRYHNLKPSEREVDPGWRGLAIGGAAGDWRRALGQGGGPGILLMVDH